MVDEIDAQDGTTNDDGPAEHLPGNRECGRESKPRGELRGHCGADEHEHEGYENEHSKSQRQGNRDKPPLPPGTPFRDVVGAIQRVDDRNHGRRAAPEGADDPEGKRGCRGRPRQSGRAVREGSSRLLRGNSAKGADQLGEGVVDGQITD